MTISFTISEFWYSVALIYAGVWVVLAFWNIAVCLSGRDFGPELDSDVWGLLAWSLIWPVLFSCVVVWFVGIVFFKAWSIMKTILARLGLSKKLLA